MSPEMKLIMADKTLIGYKQVEEAGKLSKYYRKAKDCYFTGDQECAIRIFELLASSSENPEERGLAEVSLAFYYKTGHYLEKDLKKALALYESACEKKTRLGCISAQFIREKSMK
jgi:TPR repeat protein